MSTQKNTPTLLSPNLLSGEQQEGIDRLYNFEETFLVGKMGCGKTVMALTAMADLIADGVHDRFIVFAPLKVCKEVWRQEALKWSHTRHLNIQFAEGTPAKRIKIISAMQSAQGILLLNFELMAWFFETYKRGHKFDGLYIDELSKLKGGGKGFKKMRSRLDSFAWLVGVTGTPVAEDMEGLFYQVMAVDRGARFGKNKTVFLQKYFYQADWQGYDFQLQPDGAERIIKMISDLVYTVPDYTHELPDKTHTIIKVKMPDSALEFYSALESNAVIDTEYGVQTCENAAVLSGRLEQVASGAMYCNDELGERVGVLQLHDEKIKTLKEIAKARAGENIIICYWYAHELARLQCAFPSAVNLNDAGAMTRWQAGEIPVLLMQPISASHGIQLEQGGRTMIYLKPVWSNDVKEQCDARLWRKGQTRTVEILEIVTEGTVDELIIDRVHGKKKFDAMFHDLLTGIKKAAC